MVELDDYEPDEQEEPELPLTLENITEIKEEIKEAKPCETIGETGIPADANEITVKGDIKSFIDSLTKEKDAEIVSIKSETLGIHIELISRRYDIVELSNVAFQIISKIPVELKKVGYIS